MPYLVGVGLAATVCVFAAVTGFDRDRVFYPTLVLVVASYYILFAVMGGSMAALGWESLIAGVFVVLAVVGFKTNMWLTAVALAGHGILDFFHYRLVHDAGVPLWWPAFCMSFDVLAGAFLAFLLLRRPGFSSTV